MNKRERPAERLVISAEEVARILGYHCRDSFQDKRIELEGYGFPGKLPGLNGWSRPAILRWLENNGKPGAAANDAAPVKTPLERRFG